MKYEVRCECGKPLAVSAADAGMSLRCACGRSVDVPPLHMLRTEDGDSAISPITQVRAMLRNGLLPGTRSCTGCRRETQSYCRVKIMCERVPVEEGPSQAEMVGCLLAPLVGATLGIWVFGLGRAARMQRASIGDEDAVVVPLPVCEACRPELNDADALREAVCEIPSYAALLDHYLEAEVTLVG